MEKKEVLAAIAHIEASLTVLKKELGMPTTTATPTKSPKAKTASGRGGSTEPVKRLIDDGFFNTPKTAPEVKVALTRKALKFNKNDLAVTLMRLVRSELLVRAGGDGTRTSPWLYEKA
ncbi:MAG: hypothetical protein JWL88_392 [Parcubacteria group bacterium]|nr:hypothetical protein [Parcubacteria group bacterium]